MTQEGFRKLVDACKLWLDDCWDIADLAEAKRIAQSLTEYVDRQVGYVEEAKELYADYLEQQRAAIEDDYDGPPPEGTYPNPQIVKDPAWQPKHPLDTDHFHDDSPIHSSLGGVDHPPQPPADDHYDDN